MTTSSRLISVGFVLAFVAGCNYSAQVATGADGGVKGTTSGTSGTSGGNPTDSSSSTGSSSGTSSTDGSSTGTTGTSGTTSGSSGSTTGSTGSTGTTSSGSTSSGSTSSGTTTGSSGTTGTTGTTGVSNDVCSSAATIVLGQTVTGDTTNATNDYDPGSAGCTGYNETGPDVVYAFTPSATASYTLTLTPGSTSYDAALYLLTSCPPSGSTITSCVAGSDQGSGGAAETLNVQLTAGTNYFIVVDGFGSTHGPFTLSLRQAAATCSDGIKNGTETDVDCGGGTCAACANGKVCSVASDCISSVCTGGVCQAAATCSDGIKNGTETDIDCGGGTCAACAAGKVCSVASDCTSSVCTGGVCQATSTCSDGIKNGTETDIDCGGGTCAACANGKVCLVASDCSSGVCTGGTCATAAPDYSWALWPVPPDSQPTSEYTIATDTVTDTVTGLMWQRVVPAGAYTWQQAKDYCSTRVLGGYSGWRLPTRIELLSIVDYGTYNPSINSTAFPNTPSNWFWTSSPSADFANRAWIVSFSAGDTQFSTAYTPSVRCVR